MKLLPSITSAILAGIMPLFALRLGAAEPLRPAQQSAVEEIEARQSELNEVNKAIWEFAEVGLEEHRSSALLVDKLKAAGFQVRVGVADMPTAFVAEFGSGKPIIGILAEYDALPGLSQKVSHERDPVTADAPGAFLREAGRRPIGAQARARASRPGHERDRLGGDGAWMRCLTYRHSCRAPEGMPGIRDRHCVPQPYLRNFSPRGPHGPPTRR